MDRVFVVALRKVQKFPPADVAVVAGNAIALNPALVM
jgi:hypothetical protein